MAGTGPSFDEVAWLHDNSSAWRLLRADSAPLLLSFLRRVFVAENVRSISLAELASRLDDELYALDERGGELAHVIRIVGGDVSHILAPAAGS